MIDNELSEIFLIYAAGAADEQERAQAEALLASGSPQAQAAYAEALAVVNSIPLSLERVEPPAAVRDRVLSHAVATQSTAASTRTSSASRLAAYVGWAAAACMAVALTAQISSNRRMQSELARSEAQINSMTSMVEDTRSVLRGPDVALVSMGTEAPSGGHGRVLYSSQTGKFQVMVFDLKSPPPGKVYELWLITADQKKLPAGTFTVDEKGNATIMAQAPTGVPIALTAVTDEPAGGVDVPTGTIQLAGQIPAR